MLSPLSSSSIYFLLPSFPLLSPFPFLSFRHSLQSVVFIPGPLHRLFYFQHQAIGANKCDANKVRQNLGSD